MSSDSDPSPLLQLPKIDYAEYLLDYAFEIGPSKASSDGPLVIEWVDIVAWSQMTSTVLSTWEAQVVREISKAFVAQYYISEGDVVPSPYQPIDADPVATGNRIGNLLRGLAKRKANA